MKDLMELHKKGADGKDRRVILRTDKLVKNYDNGLIVTKVLHEIEIFVYEGEFVSIMGPSGSGKSTLLYQLGLIDNPTSGGIYIEDREVTCLAHPQKQELRLNELGFVFQDYALVPELSAAENVMVPLLMKGYSKRKAFEISSEHLEKVGLAHRINNTPSQMSGGEQQRVSIARAVAHNPKILYADEPTASLDSEMSEVVMKVFLDLHKQGQTIVMVTHEPEYGQMADRIIHVKDGVLWDHGFKDARQTT